MKEITNIQKYIKLYEDDKVTPRVYYALTLEEYLKEQTNVYIKFLHDADMPYDSYRELHIKVGENNPEKDVTRKIGLWTELIKNPYHYLLYKAFSDLDWQTVNDAQYQYGKHELWRNYPYYDIRNAWHLMAANDFSLLHCNGPDGFSEAYLKVFTAPGNMMMGLYAHDDAAVKRGITEAEKLLGQKTVGKWYKELSRFMLSLVDRDMQEASRSLNALCEGYRWYDNESIPIEKLFCTPAHGLYNLARKLLSTEEFARLEMPSHVTFFQEFALWQQNNGYPVGKQTLVYPEHPFRFMNEIINLPALPRNVPYETLGKKWIEIYGKGIVNSGANNAG